MKNKVKVEFELIEDGSDEISFEDTYDGLEDKEWYKFEVDGSGGVSLWANREGFEHLARYFLKLSRTEKELGFHTHHALEYGKDSHGPPELTITLCNEPDEH